MNGMTRYVILSAVAILILWYGIPSSIAAQSISVVSVLVDEEALARPHDVELMGNLAFVPGKAGSLAIIDIADAASPRILWHIYDEVGRMEDAETVLPMPPWLFLGSNDFSSINIADPRRPRFLKTISNRLFIQRINGMVRRGDHIIAAGKDGYISVFDVSDPHNPLFAGAYPARENDNMGWPHDIDLTGERQEYIITVDPARFGMLGEPGKVAIYRIADPSTGKILPVDRWTLISQIIGYDLDGANRIDVFGHFACVTGSNTDHFGNVVLLDISDPEKMKRTAIMPFPDSRGPNGLTVAGKIAFAAGGQTIGAIDVSDPLRPSFLTVIKPLEIFPDGKDNAHDLVYRDGYLYVTGQNSSSFGILKIHDTRILQLASDTNYQTLPGDSDP
jgi:hypothetical protein